MPDVFKILKDLELKAVGLDPETNKMQEGYFVSFRNIGLPIRKEDFERPWRPNGPSPAPVETDATNGASANGAAGDPKTGSSKATEDAIAAANLAQSETAYLNTFLLTDDKLKMSPQYAVMPQASKVSDSWWAVITGANGVPTKSNLSPELQAAYDAARAVVMDDDLMPTAKQDAYDAYKGKYDDAVDRYQTEYAAVVTDPVKRAQWPKRGVRFQRDIDLAMAKWRGFGFKHEVEDAMDILAAQGTDPSIALIRRAKDRFENSLYQFEGFGSIPYTTLLPSTWYDKDKNDGWYQYTSTDFHTETHWESSSTSFGGGVGLDVGFWSVGGSFNHAEQHKSLGIQTNDLEVSFKYAVADIKRPWLDTSLLNLRNWFLRGDYAKGTISTGTMGQELPSNGTEPVFLPSIVTGLVVVKDLRIKWSNWKSDWATASSSDSAGGSIGYGPFAVHGNYSRGDEKRDFRADASGECLESAGVQLLGYVSTINPLSPGMSSSEQQTPATPVTP
jgi:hypothetical protein